MKDWRHSEGAPFPLGVTWREDERAFDFAIYSEHATRVTLLFFEPENLQSERYRYEFRCPGNKTGPVWHARIPLKKIDRSLLYAYCIDGPASNSPYGMFSPEKLLLDPYAREIFVPPEFDRSAAYGGESNRGRAALNVLPLEQDAFDWEDDKPPRHFGDLIIYEMHVRGFTMNPNSGVAPEHRGTFQGIVEKIPYLQSLGITAVELMPVFGFDATEPNYWGYMPISFFAPHHLYAAASSPGNQIAEFKRMVKALHRAGIEVLLDVVYNHTGEGNELGPILNFKGIDCRSYYIESGDPNSPFADFTGTGNTFNCSHRAVRQLILDSLRYWVREMHVDGFRFDLASVFSRNQDGSINFQDPPIFGDIAEDPDLEKVRLIAEPWEGNSKYPNYALGADQSKPHFPGTGWRQWNDQFRNTVRHFVKGDSGIVGECMRRLYGSADLFPDSLADACRPYQSLNYIDSHDGPTLYDLVAYSSPDGWNCGEQDGERGMTEAVLALRKRQVKNFCCLLMLANGTPMFRAGDEFLLTQHGETNPYNIDGLLTWIDWERFRTHADIFRFFSEVIRFRKRHHSIGRSTFWREDVRWYGVRDAPDLGYWSHAFAWCLKGASQDDNDLYVLINAYWEPLTFRIQEHGDWRRIVDTGLDGPCDFTSEEEAQPLLTSEYNLGPRSIAVFIS